MIYNAEYNRNLGITFIHNLEYYKNDVLIGVEHGYYIKN